MQNYVGFYDGTPFHICGEPSANSQGETFLASEPSVQLVFASISACEVSEVPGRWPLKKDEKEKNICYY